MGVVAFLTAFRIWSASFRRPAVTFLPPLLLAILPACASVDVLMLSSQTFTRQTSTVEILEQAPTRPYVQIAFLTVDSSLLSADSRREKIVEKAAELGADAVVFGYLRPTEPAAGNRTAGQTAPPSSLPPKDTDTVMPDDLHSSLQNGVLDGDVRIYLVRGGGHGGGRGGGHGHGGHWGGRAGHFRYGHGGYSRGYWGYGFYGPAWGYGPYWGPYWGGYYPYNYYGPYGYYGGYSYPGYGYTNTVTFGTAIHYTD